MFDLSIYRRGYHNPLNSYIGVKELTPRFLLVTTS